MYQTLISKFIKNKIVETDAVLREHIPEYLPYTRNNLRYLVEKYGVAFIKKDASNGGAVSVFKVEADGKKYKIMDANGKTTSQLITNIPHWIPVFHIVQQGIVSIGHEGNSLEMRVYLQKNSRQWEVMGVVPKVAPSHTFSPLLERGGKSLKYEDVFGDDTDFLEHIHIFCKRGAEVLNDSLPGLKEIGYDLGIDENKKLWIFEMNTKPSAVTFEPLDKELHRKIKANKNRLEKSIKAPEFTIKSLESGCRSCGGRKKV